jgi:hypothetical protein
MKDIQAIDQLQNEAEQKMIAFKHYVQTRSLTYAQDAMFPSNSQYYPIGETEPIWIAIDRIVGDEVWFHYASVMTPTGPKPGPTGTRKALNNRLMTERCLEQIKTWFSIAQFKGPVFFQVITTRQGKAHKWEEAFWVYPDQAIRHTFMQNGEKQ